MGGQTQDAPAGGLPATTASVQDLYSPHSSSDTPTIKPKKRNPNYLRTQTTSPEIISSLIDSLTAISASTHSHLDNLSVDHGDSDTGSVATSPRVPTFGTRDFDGFDSTGHYQLQKEQAAEQSSDDACEPPVIRTSKPPSGKPTATARKKKETDGLLRNYMSRNTGSSSSLQSTHSLRSVNSIGNISVEAGTARQPSNASTRSSADGKNGTKRHRKLMYMSSRELLRHKDADRKRSTARGLTPTPTEDGPRSPTGAHSVANETINEEPIAAEPTQSAQRGNVVALTGLSQAANPLLRRSSCGPNEMGLIPERASSLRHAESPTRREKRHSKIKAETSDPAPPVAAPEALIEVDQEALVKEKILKELEEEEDEVARRIRELRKQKLLRDRIAGKLPVGVDAGASSVAHVSPPQSVDASPMSPPSRDPTPQPGQNPGKAHKLLGLTMPATASGDTANSVAWKHEPSPVGNAFASRGHNRNSTVSSDQSDLTPLPINYRLALESLDRSAPSSPRFNSSDASVRSETTVSSSPPPKASQSMAKGGRVALGRRSISAMAIGSSAVSSDATSTGIAPGDQSLRSASEEMGRHSLNGGHASGSNAAKRGSSLKSKRWSHPDLPAKAEKTHNDKVDALNAKAKASQWRSGAVQSPAHSVIEERPASADSIDMEVRTYLDSPRLTQKICHPQTGRVISFSEVGDPEGFAIFVCVGMGLTRYVMAFYDQLATTLKLRLITPDRPGIGGSQVDPNGTPLSWPDDVLIICQSLKITKFSILAHSAGAVYALATSLRMPQHIRGRVHLLAPWIPPSQMEPIGVSQDQPPTQQLPRSQRFLRALPPSLLKVANSTFLSATSASLQGPKTSPRTRRKSMNPATTPGGLPVRPTFKDSRRESMMLMDQVLPNASTLSIALPASSDPGQAPRSTKDDLSLADRQRRQDFDERLTFAIWDRATLNANPATDLIVCLETKQSIGFRYEDINRSVVIHHGTKDSRVPVDNVRWLGRLMRKCEVRILEGEQHGLMASAAVMGNVLTEMAGEWEDWTAVVQGKTGGSASERILRGKRTVERLRGIGVR